MALEVVSLLCTFENSSNCIITSFDLDSFLKSLFFSKQIYLPSQLFVLRKIDFIFLSALNQIKIKRKKE